LSLPVIILGAGGHSKVLIEALLASSAVIAGVVDPDFSLFGTTLLGVPVLGGDDVVSEFSPSEIYLVNGLGSVGLPVKRQQLFEKFKDLGYNFAIVAHPSAVVASDVVLGEGAQIMAGVVIQPGCRIGIDPLFRGS
jgi:FlaA1/EpsC-like NDP-sugar epimerase